MEVPRQRRPAGFRSETGCEPSLIVVPSGFEGVEDAEIAHDQGARHEQRHRCEPQLGPEAPQRPVLGHPVGVARVDYDVAEGDTRDGHGLEHAHESRRGGPHCS
jgi:hypothetical protein